MIADLETILEPTIRLAVLLLFAALGEYVAERAGTINISVEAMMLAGAYSAALGAAETGSPVLGALLGVGAGLVVAAMQAHLSHNLDVNQFVVGIALSTLAIGVTTFLFHEISGSSMAGGLLHVVEIPGLAAIPLIGEALFAQPWPTYLIVPAAAAVWWAVQRTGWGLEVRAVGENPTAADMSGVPVLARRRQAIYACGLLSGLSGSYLAVGLVGGFSQYMTAGKGFIAIAAVLFGGWRLWGTIAGALLFGFADALAVALPAVGVENVPGAVLDSMPFVLAFAGLLVFATRARKPDALAEPFTRGAA